MATKDEYYQKILASQQAQITSLRTDLADMRKELESLKTSIAETPRPAPTTKPKRVNYESDEIMKFMQRVSDVCDSRIQQREALLLDRFVGKRTLKSSGNQSMRNSSLPKLSPNIRKK